MKKNILTFIISLGAFCAHAQLSLTRSDFTQAPNKFVYGVDLNYVNNDVKKTGDNQTWDFTNLQNQAEDITLFHIASTTPNYSSFPNSDIALQLDSSDDMMYYIMDGTDSIVVIGSTDSAISNIHFRPFVFPLILNTSWTDKGRNMLQTSGKAFGYPQADSVRITIDYQFTNTVDGEGKLKMVSGEIESLKIRTINKIAYKIDAKIGIWLPITNESEEDTSYSFYAANNGYAIVSMESRGDGTYRTRHKDIIKNTSSVNTVNSSENTLNVYPNPATNYLNVSFKGANSFKITDMTGREMMMGHIENNAIEISKLSSGNYIIRVLKDNETIGIQKFVKQ